ncbi:hypothetical protein MPSEU_000568100 [Mayamaea pseudoterrestris]|nr:hypothetical protein MPSEU_000568100 [Mayamaea pseudoterrestris]
MRNDEQEKNQLKDFGMSTFLVAHTRDGLSIGAWLPWLSIKSDVATLVWIRSEMTTELATNRNKVNAPNGLAHHFFLVETAVVELFGLEMSAQFKKVDDLRRKNRAMSARYDVMAKRIRSKDACYSKCFASIIEKTCSDDSMETASSDVRATPINQHVLFSGQDSYWISTNAMKVIELQMFVDCRGDAQCSQIVSFQQYFLFSIIFPYIVYFNA